MMNKLDSVGLGGTVLNIKQGFALTRNDINDEINSDRFYQMMQTEIDRRQTVIVSLRNVIVSPEIKVLFPTVKDIALTHMVAATTGSDKTDTVSMIFVNAPQGLTPSERQKLTDYIKVRLGQRKMHLTVNPTNFPWPSGS